MVSLANNGLRWRHILFLMFLSFYDSFSPLSLLLSDHYRGLADLFLHFCLFFLMQRASISVKCREITLWHRGGLQTHNLWGLLRMSAISLCFDPGRALGCYTQARKGWCRIICVLWTAPVFRFGLDRTAWGLVTDTFPLKKKRKHLSHRVFSPHHHFTLQCVYQDEKAKRSLHWPALSWYLAF